MDRNTNKNTDKRPGGSYSGRFGSSAATAGRRPTGSYRSQPAGSYRSRVGYGERADDVRRPSMRDGGDSYTRRPEPKAEVSKADPKNSKRGKGKKSRRWLGIAVAVLVLLLAALALVLLLDDGGSTVHMLPTVERI